VCRRGRAGRERDGQPGTRRPATYVSSTRMSLIASRRAPSGSSPRTTKSATLPTEIEPRSASSWPAHAASIVNIRNA